MTYKSALKYIHGLNAYARRPSLDRIRTMLDKLGNPHRELKFVHIAGTNGKGSTTTMITSILTAHGLKVGKFTSPYVLDFCERIMIGNKMISRAELAEITEIVAEAAKQTEEEIGEHPREFEVITGIAMVYYARKKCDIVALEVGIGGREDATNVIESSLVSVITPVGLDHTKYLGSTVVDITDNKCGIIKKGNVVVANPHQRAEAMAVIVRKSAENDSELNIPQLSQVAVTKMDTTGSEFSYHGNRYKIKLVGEHQIGNAITAIDTVLALSKYGISVTAQTIAKGLGTAFIAARMEIVRRAGKTIVLDGAHNPHGMEALKKTLDKIGVKKPVAVIGVLADKNYHETLEVIAPYLPHIIATEASTPRGLRAEILGEYLEKLCADVVVEKDYIKAIEKALAQADDTVIVIGSLYTVADVRKFLMKKD